MMKIKKFNGLPFLLVSLILAPVTVSNSCRNTGDQFCGRDKGGISLDFSSLPADTPLVMFTVDQVVGIRLYDPVIREGAALWCRGHRELPQGSGNWEDAAVIFLFSKLPCNVSSITAEVHGHGKEARMVAAQRDGTTQTAICPGNRRILTLSTPTRDNPFIYAILSGQEAQWINFKLE